MDAAIATRIEETHHLLIGEPTAQSLKIRIGSAVGAIGGGLLPVMGRSVDKGVPCDGVVMAYKSNGAITQVLKVVGGAVQEALRTTPPELIGQMRVADAPASCVARGLGDFLDPLRSPDRASASEVNG